MYRQNQVTSKAAAVAHAPKLSLRRFQVLDLVHSHGGRTSNELGRDMAAAHPTLPIVVAVNTPHKRLPELEKLGLIRKGIIRQCSDTGQKCYTWWITQEGRNELANSLHEDD